MKLFISLMLGGIACVVTGLIGHAVRIGNLTSDFRDVLAGEVGDMKVIKEPLMEVSDGLGGFPTVWHVLIMTGACSVCQEIPISMV